MQAVRGVMLRYSYKVDGEFYGGSALALLSEEDLHNDFLLRLKDQPIQVSYNPKDHSESTVTPEQVNLVRLHLALATGAPPELGDLALFAPVRLCMQLMIGVALLGFIASVCDHLAAAFARPLLSPAQFSALYLLAFVLAVPTALIRLFVHYSGAHRNPGTATAPPVGGRLLRPQLCLLPAF